MAAVPRPTLVDLPDSPYAAELLRADPRGRFSPELETEYVRIELSRNRALIRTISTCAVALSIGHTVEQAASGLATAPLLAQLALLVASSIALAWLAWSTVFERWYEPCANVLVPLRNAVAAIHIATAAAHGELMLLMTIPVMVISAYFFLGLKFRVAVFTNALTSVSFVVTAAFCGLALPISLRACAYLLATLVGGAIAALQIERRSRTSFLESHLVAELAQRDALTGMKNRRVFNEHLTRTWQQAVTDRRVLSIVLIDVDHFKAYNDRYGHLAGDEALRSVARAVQRFVQRPLDVLARYGGEEFAAILYDMPGEEAKDTAERMRRAVTDLAIEHRGSRTAEMVTISIGVAAIAPADGRECWGALQLADQALYEAKVRGRNTVELMDDAEYELLVTGVFPSNVAQIRRPSESARGPHASRAYGRVPT
jgi:diguanylate cyclase (GGDEF)-like protein